MYGNGKSDTSKRPSYGRSASRVKHTVVLVECILLAARKVMTGISNLYMCVFSP